MGWADPIRLGEVLDCLHIAVAQSEETLAHNLTAALHAADWAADAHLIHVGRRGTGIPVDLLLDSGPNGCV